MNIWAWIILIFGVIGCASKRSSDVAYAFDDYGAVGGFAEADVEASIKEAPAPTRSTRVESERQIALVRPTDEAKPPPATLEPVSPQPSRMVHYDGYARMRATRPAETLDQIASIALEVGGRVDRLNDTQATVRVPVDAFDDTWDAILDLGDVLDKSVRADDITDQFRATDLRVKTLRTMRTRLVRLLARARSEEEKLALLEQITRVTEELDRTESRLRVLRDLASMSRISVDVVPREFGPQRRELVLSGFGWIRGLSPFDRGVYSDTKRLELDTPEEMVSLTKSGPYIAESPKGTVLWSMRLPNDPQGDADYWRSAVHESLAEDFENVSRRTVGEWACLSLDEPGAEEPYRWQICLATSGRHIQLVQAYFPDAAEVERFGERIEQALIGGGDA
ncbi:MAG: DUF4349 domain-containing protein [Myxococcota bacterium]